jgi:hypothetical protein
MGDSPADELYISEHPVSSIFIGDVSSYTTYEDKTECSETSEYEIQTPGNHPEEYNIKNMASVWNAIS